jgi:hypothetical protein
MCVNYSTIAAELYNQAYSLVLLLCHDIRCYYNQYMSITVVITSYIVGQRE